MNIAVVTGASSGIGREFAKALDKKGAFDQIWLIARSRDKLSETSEMLKGASKILSLDLAKESAWEEYESELEKSGCSVTCLVNCAGYGKFGKYDAASLEETVGMIDVNCRALTAMTMKTLPYMPDGSKILNMGSASSFQPLPYINVYAATKSYVLFYSRALNDELRDRNITVTAVCPYWVDTDFFKVAKNTETPNVINKFEVMASPADVVAKALADSEKGKDKSSYGIVNKFQQLSAKLAPYPLIRAIWSRKQSLGICSAKRAGKSEKASGGKK